MAGRVIGTATVKIVADGAGFRSGLRGITSGIGSMVHGISRAISALGLDTLARDAIKMGTEYRKQLDNARASVVGLTDSQATADRLLKDMTEFAIKTPFDLPGVQNVTTRLLALGKGFGVTSDNVLNFVQTLGDMAAISGKGSEAMLNVANIMGRISGQGRVMTKDMNQLTANFPSLHPWEILSKMTGQTEQALRKLAAKPGGLSGVVDSTAFINELLTTMRAAPGVAGAMERRMATLEGSMELFKDTMGVALANGLQPFFTALQQFLGNPAILDALTGLIAGFGNLVSTIMEGIAPSMPVIVAGFTALVDALGPLAPIITVMGAMFGQLLQAIVPIVEALLQGLVPILPMVRALFTQLLNAIGPLVEQLIAGLLPLLPSVIHLFQVLVAALLPVAETILNGLLPVLPTLIDMFAQMVAVLGPVALQLANAILPVLPLIVDLFTQLFTALAPLISQLITGLAPVLPLIAQLFGQIITVLAPIISALITGLAPVLPIIAQLFSEIVSALGPLVAGFVDGLMPFIGPLAQLFVELVQAVAPFGPTIQGIFRQLLPPLLGLLQALAPLIPLLGDLLVGALETLLPLVKPLIKFITQVAGVLVAALKPVLPIIVQAFVRLGDALGPVLAALGDQLIAVLLSLVPLLVPLANAFLAIVNALIPLMPLVAQFITLFGTQLAGALNIMVPLMVEIINTLAAMLVAFTPVIAVVAGFATDVTGWITTMVDKVQKLIGDVIEFIVGGFERLYNDTVGKVIEIVQDIIDFFTHLWDELVGHSIIPDMINAIVDWFFRMPGMIIDAVTKGLSALLQLGSDLVGWIFDGIKTAIEAVWTFFREIAGKIAGFVGATFNTITHIGKDIIGWIVDGITTAAVDVWNFFKDLPGNIVSWVSGTFSTLVGLGKTLVQKIVEGIGNMGSAIFDAIMDKIPGGGVVRDVAGAVLGGLSKIPGLEVGGFVSSPTLAMLGERSKREVVIPLTNPGRAMQLMQQAGLDRLAALNTNGGFGGPLITMPGAVIQDATDADLVAQRTLVALRAQMIAIR